LIVFVSDVKEKYSCDRKQVKFQSESNGTRNQESRNTGTEYLEYYKFYLPYLPTYRVYSF
jgi:hypothetical protein